MRPALVYLWLLEAMEFVLGAQYPHVWPLGNFTCGYDVVAGSDALQPKLGSCLLSIGSQHPGLPYRSLALIGTGTFLDLPVTTKVGMTPTVFTVNVKPWSLGGTILHYTTTEDCRNCVMDMRVDLNTDGTLTFSITVETTNPVSTSIPSVVLEENQWNYLAIGFDEIPMEVLVVHEILGGGKTEQALAVLTAAHTHLDSTKGHLRVGAKADGSNGFSGEVACASLEMDTRFPSYVNSTSQCKRPWPNNPPATPVFSVSPDWVIPLHDTNAGYDVLGNVLRRYNNGARDLRVDPAVTPLEYGSLRMDGSPLSTVDLNFDLNLLQSVFTLTFYVSTSSSVMGTLAHVRKSGAAGTGIREVVIGANVTHVVAKFGNGGGSFCGQVTTSRPFSSASSWDVIGVGKFGNFLFATYGNGIKVVGNPCSANLFLNGPALLRLGGSFDKREGFHGNLGCFVLFKTFAMAATSTTDACNGPHSIPQGGIPLQTQVQSFGAVQKNLQPAGTLFTPRSEFKARSLLACATACRSRSHCRSFTVSKVNDSSRERQCSLYDFLTVDNLQSRDGTDYYVLSLS